MEKKNSLLNLGVRMMNTRVSISTRNTVSAHEIIAKIKIINADKRERRENERVKERLQCITSE